MKHSRRDSVNKTTDKELINELKEREKPHTVHKVIEIYIIPVFHLATAIAVGLVAYYSYRTTYSSYKVMEKSNEIIDTANLLVIYDAIQTRMDALSSLTIEYEALQSLHDVQKIEDDTPLLELMLRKNNAIISFLNTFEFACLQYENNKIDKEAFKLFYDDNAFKALLFKYDDWINNRSCPNIINVLEKWKIEGASQ